METQAIKSMRKAFLGVIGSLILISLIIMAIQLSGKDTFQAKVATEPNDIDIDNNSAFTLEQMPTE